MKRLTYVSLLAVIIFLIFSPSVNATSTGSSSASIDWSSVSITPSSLTTFDVFLAAGTVQIDANVKGSTSDVRINQSHFGMDTNIRVTYDIPAGSRTVHLDALVDLINANTITAQVSNSSLNAGTYADLSTAQQWIYIILHGEGKLNVQADYQLSISGSASIPNGDGIPYTWATAGVDLIDEGDNGFNYIGDWKILTDPTQSPLSGRFNDDVTAPVERVLRLAFEADAFSEVFSTPVPEPTSIMLVGAGLAGLALYRIRKRRPDILG